MENQVHSFRVGAAEKVGVNAAIILQNLAWWIAKNKANGKNHHDGRYWTYNSIAAFAELFPYMSTKQISGALKKLEDGGYIVTGNYNATPYDRTKWYALTEEGFALAGYDADDSSVQEKNFDSPKKENGNNSNGEPIPVVNQIENQIEKEKENSPFYEDAKGVLNHMNDELGSHFKPTEATIKAITARMRDGYSREELEQMVDFMISKWGSDPKMTGNLRPSTLFRPSNCEGYVEWMHREGGERKKKPRTFGEYFKG